MMKILLKCSDMSAVVALHNEELNYVSVNSRVGLVSGLTADPSNIMIHAHTLPCFEPLYLPR